MIKMKILYLEDNSSDAELTIRRLHQSFTDCKIYHAPTLSKAKNILKKDQVFDLVLIDMNLPDGNGLELLIELREKHISPTIIVLTGSGDEESAVAALKAGADDYITKKVGHLDSLPTLITTAIKNHTDHKSVLSQEISVLYIEHNEADIELTKRHFKHYAPNFSIKDVYTGEEALKILPSGPSENCKYCVILLDYRLTGMNALEFVKIIRQERNLNIAIVMVTGQGNEEIAIEALRLGVDEYLVKRPNYLFRLPSLLTSAYQYHELERKKMALEKSESLYRLLVNNSSDVIFILDMDLKYTFVSPAVYNLRGYTSEEAVNQQLEHVLTPDSLTLVKKIFANALEKEKVNGRYFHEPMIMELEMLRKNGSKVWTEVKASLLSDTNGNPSGIFGVTRDISVRKKAELELIIAKEKAEESDRLKTAFLNNISHEIRTPMNAIIGFSEFLVDPDTDLESRQHFANVITQSSNQLLSIVTDIINIASIEAGQEKIQETEVNLNQTLNLIYDQYANDFEKKNLKFSFRSPLSINESQIKTDKIKLVQILSNLVSNALKFSSKGSVEYGYTIQGHELEFFVKDEGIGISAEMHQSIFERFRQVESTATRQYGGSGLGLSIAKAYTKMLGGKIWLDSEPGKGTTFYFTIPYHKLSGKSSIPDNKMNIDETEKKQIQTILIAEDETYNFILFEEIFKGYSFELIKSINGVDTIEKYKSNPNIDLILMDLKMPIMDGLEATREIRKFDKDIIIIAQTAYALKGDREKALAAGCNDYISKPIKKELLIELIEKYFKVKT